MFGRGADCADAREVFAAANGHRATVAEETVQPGRPGGAHGIGEQGDGPDSTSRGKGFAKTVALSAAGSRCGTCRIRGPTASLCNARMSGDAATGSEYSRRQPGATRVTYGVPEAETSAETSGDGNVASADITSAIVQRRMRSNEVRLYGPPRMPRHRVS